MQWLQQFRVGSISLGIGEAPQFPASAEVVREWFMLRDRGAPTGLFAVATSLRPGLALPFITLGLEECGVVGLCDFQRPLSLIDKPAAGARSVG